MDETPTSPTGADQPTRDASPLPLNAPRRSGGNLPQRGEQIGPYTLLELIGEGGFGTVWLAERREPMVQRVAIKIIKPGMDSKAVVARFEQERQALAVMDHPNVAKVFDGGVSDRGLPYFVMEHVAGEPLTNFCDKHRLTIRQRLELFTSVCDAVQHAHMKGIIHRDIKPSNVLAEMLDGKPLVKVIDFGIAKAMDTSEVQNSIFSMEGQLIGTPEYMSPEQAGGQADIDTRTDVYSLGVMLYELLVGRLPFDPATLRQRGMDEIRRIIREDDPPRPSTRLSTIGAEGSTIALSRHHHSPATLIRELRRELEWIPLKAMRKERERRYESAAAFGEDVRRYLDGRALRAAPESRVYLARKFVGRNRAFVGGTLAVIAALAAGLGGTLWQTREAARQRDVALLAESKEAEQRLRADERAAAATKAEAEARTAQAAEKARADELKQVSDFQASMLSQIDTTQAGIDLMADVRERLAAALERSGVTEEDRTKRLQVFRQELVRVNATDTAASIIDRTILKPAVKAIDERFKDQPVVDASLRQAVADLYRAIGLYDAAFPLQELALATRRRVIGQDHPDTLRSISNMGSLLHDQGKLAEAETYYREAREKFRRVLGEEHPETLISINNMGVLLQAQGKLAEAEPYLREALEKCRRLLGEEQPATLETISNMGSLLQAQGKLAEAEPYYREAREKFRRVLGEEHPITLSSINNMGGLLQAQGKLAEAEPYWREALEKRRRVMGEEHPNTLYSIANMGSLLQDLGNLAEAESYFREALEKFRRVLGEEHPDTLTSISNIGNVLQAQGQLAEAEPYYREALEKRRRVLGEEHPDTLNSIHNLGSLLQNQGKLAEAETYFREAIEKFRRVLGQEHPETLNSVSIMGFLLQSQGKLTEAETYWREALEKRRRVLGEEHPDTLTSINNIGALLQAQGRLAEAQTYFREALEKRRRVQGEEHPETLISINNMGNLLRAQGKFAEADPYYREALEKRRGVLGEEHRDTLITVSGMSQLKVDQHKPREAIDLITPYEPAARKALTGGNARRLADFLTAFGCARIGLGFDAERFILAEANLREAHAIYIAAKDRGPTHKDTLVCVQAHVDLYTAWDKAEPGKGYDIKAAEWKAKLPAPAESAPDAAAPAAAPPK